MTPFPLTNDQKVTDTPAFATASGKPCAAPAGRTPLWTPGDSVLAALTVAPNGLSAEIVPVDGAVGTYTYGFDDGGGLAYTQDIAISNAPAASVAPGLSAPEAKA